MLPRYSADDRTQVRHEYRVHAYIAVVLVTEAAGVASLLPVDSGKPVAGRGVNPPSVERLRNSVGRHDSNRTTRAHWEIAHSGVALSEIRKRAESLVSRRAGHSSGVLRNERCRCWQAAPLLSRRCYSASMDLSSASFATASSYAATSSLVSVTSPGGEVSPEIGAMNPPLPRIASIAPRAASPAVGRVCR